ncbi:sensor histidine kinase [Thermobifida cellulosilytica]|uniref:sensor histidine kinase n=1 Tax=Thermobifida cellulosilytica TaxID=144786 RepID=UPI0008390F2C|nr:histidine kinase [Thermobifida cellulosilytica]
MTTSAAALRRFAEVLRPVGDWSGRDARIRDALLVLALAPVVVLGVVGARGEDWEQAASAPVVAEAAATVLVLVGVVLLARPWPLPALALAFLASAWLPSFALPTAVVAYLAGRRTPRSRPAFALFGLIAVGGALLVALPDPAEATSWFTAVTVLTFTLLFPWVVGLYRRQRAELAAAGWELAEQLEREQRIVADRARLRERSRIAQDMHDSLGHELSLIALRAAALEVAPGTDEHVRQAARELRESAAAATDRLHEIIGVLRDDAEPAPVRPVDEDVSALVDRARAAGMTVTLERRGRARRLPPMTDRAVYRVVQEALTNAGRHAPGAEVAVRLDHAPDRVEVRVVNGPPDRPAAAPAGGGNGLIGLRERVSLAGGVLRAGRHGEGWQVEARLPVREEAGDRRDPEPGTAEHSLTARYYRQVRHRVRWGLAAFVALLCLGAAAVAAVALMAGG